MNVGFTVKDLLLHNRWKFAFGGALLGIYFNILHSTFFYEILEIYLVFGLVAFAAIALYVAAVVWDLEEPKYHVKLGTFQFGANLASIFFSIIYLVEVVVGNYALELLKNPLYFPISRNPPVSFVISLSMAVVLSLVQVLLSEKK